LIHIFTLLISATLDQPEFPKFEAGSQKAIPEGISEL